MIIIPKMPSEHLLLKSLIFFTIRVVANLSSPIRCGGPL
jgi:hypothetical protein